MCFEIHSSPTTHIIIIYLFNICFVKVKWDGNKSLDAGKKTMERRKTCRNITKTLKNKLTSLNEPPIHKR